MDQDIDAGGIRLPTVSDVAQSGYPVTRAVQPPGGLGNMGLRDARAYLGGLNREQLYTLPTDWMADPSTGFSNPSVMRALREQYSSRNAPPAVAAPGGPLDLPFLPPVGVDIAQSGYPSVMDVPDPYRYLRQIMDLASSLGGGPMAPGIGPHRTATEMIP